MYPKVFLLFLALSLSADMLQINDKVTPIILKSQHNKEQKLLSNGIWIITFDKKRAKITNDFFGNTKIPKDINLIMDTTRIPSFLFNLFVLPRIKKHNHQILLSHDEKYNSILPYKEDHLTILHIENKIVKRIKYIKTKEELEKFFQKP